MTNGIHLSRRHVFQGLIALSAGGGLTACGGAEETPNRHNTEIAAPGYFIASEMAFITAVAQTIIPKTDTAGAVQAGVPDTLQRLATEWGDDEFRAYWRTGLVALKAALSPDGQTEFVSLNTKQRTDALIGHDAGVFSETIEDTFYRDFKATVVDAYYMSESGASEELAHEPVPGDWIACAPLSDFPKNWAT